MKKRVRVQYVPIIHYPGTEGTAEFDEPRGSLARRVDLWADFAGRDYVRIVWYEDAAGDPDGA